MLETPGGHSGPAVDQLSGLGSLTRPFRASISHLLTQIQSSLSLRMAVTTEPSTVLGYIVSSTRPTRTAGTPVKHRLAELPLGAEDNA